MARLSTSRPTMRDVARVAGVSLKTVSRVVNHEIGVTIGLEERVRTAINDLGYQPDDRARYLRRRDASTRSLGLVQMDVANPFFSAIFRGLEDVARANGYLVLAGSSDADPDVEEALVRAFVARRVDGLVIASGRSDLSSVAAEVGRGTPAVFVDLQPRLCIGDVVRSDHHGGAALAARHLIDHGHGAIAFLGDRAEFFSANERRRGFVDVMAAAGLPPRWVIGDLRDPAAAEHAVSELFADALADRPTALFTAQNFVTLGAVRALHRLGLQRRVALVGFDDLAMADLVHPAVTVVPQKPLELGRIAGERLFARLADNGRPLERTVLTPELIARGSGELPPAW